MSLFYTCHLIVIDNLAESVKPIKDDIGGKSSLRSGAAPLGGYNPSIKIVSVKFLKDGPKATAVREVPIFVNGISCNFSTSALVKSGQPPKVEYE